MKLSKLREIIREELLNERIAEPMRDHFVTVVEELEYIVGAGRLRDENVYSDPVGVLKAARKALSLIKKVMK